MTLALAALCLTVAVCSPAHAGPILQISPFELARIGVGEAGPESIWGSEDAALTAARWVMWTVRNRLEAPEFPADYDPLTDYYGAAETASPHMVGMALDVLMADADDDPTGGALFVLNKADREWLAFPLGDKVLRGGSRFELNFYREWHGG